MTIRITALSTILALALAMSAGTVSAQEEEGGPYAYTTYYYCDVTLQERADEIVEQLDKPIYDAAVDDGTIGSWGWLVHHTGGKWRRAQYHMAPTMEALLASQQKIGDQIEAKNKKLSTEGGKICNAHDDYIWRVVAGTEGSSGPRGKAGFSTYHICDQSRETQADELVKRVFAPIYDRMVAEGKLVSWGWLEHIVGGEYRRLETITATDVPALMKARAALVEALSDDDLGDTMTDICGSHSDYIWEIKFTKP